MIVRIAVSDDAPAMAALLNAVIAIGGTTAHEHPKSAEDIRNGYIEGPAVQTAVVAEEDGRIIGWQSVELWQGEMHIGSFVQPGLQAKGVGAALFALTCRLVRDKGLTEIIAAIRADNRPGLAYYSRLGFADIGGDPDFALEDGRVVGRIIKRFDLTG